MAIEKELPLALHCVPVADLGGVARHLTDLATTGLPGYRLVVLCPPGPLSVRLREQAVEVYEAGFGPDSGFVASFRSLATAINDLDPAVVHTHLAYADVVGVMVVNLLKLRRIGHRGRRRPLLVTSEHGIAGSDRVYHRSSWRSQLMRTVHRVRLWGTDGAIAVSRSTAEQMEAQWGAQDVRVIYNGLDVSATSAAVEAKQTPANPGALRVLSLSRLAPEKGLDLLLEAFKLVHRKRPGATLEIAGSGPLRAELEKQVESLGLENSVTFPGFVDPLEAMGRADVLVQLSVWENCSYTLLDAKAAGLAPVATAVGGNPEILAADELVPALEKMGRQAAVTAVAERILERAGKPRRDFEWIGIPQMAREIADFYREVAER